MKKFIYYIVSPAIVGYGAGRLIGLGFTQGNWNLFNVAAGVALITLWIWETTS